MSFIEQIDALVEARFAGQKASAVKRGRRAEWPYVPVIVHTGVDAGGVPFESTRNPLKGVAFATRDEAVARAQMCIDAYKAWDKKALAEPRMRALRKSYGLPEVI